MVGGNGGHTGSVVVPSFSVFTGSPSHVASSKARKNTPSFVAQSEMKMEILKRQYICLSQVNELKCHPFLETKEMLKDTNQINAIYRIMNEIITKYEN